MTAVPLTLNWPPWVNSWQCGGSRPTLQAATVKTSTNRRAIRAPCDGSVVVIDVSRLLPAAVIAIDRGAAAKLARPGPATMAQPRELCLSERSVAHRGVDRKQAGVERSAETGATPGGRVTAAPCKTPAAAIGNDRRTASGGKGLRRPAMLQQFVQR